MKCLSALVLFWTFTSAIAANGADVIARIPFKAAPALAAYDWKSDPNRLSQLLERAGPNTRFHERASHPLSWSPRWEQNGGVFVVACREH
jgi:hypothetical protein